MKKFNLISIIYVFLMMICFFSFSSNVQAYLSPIPESNITQTTYSGVIVDKMVYPDGSTYEGTRLIFWGNDYAEKLTSNTIAWFWNTNNPFRMDAFIRVASADLHTGSIVTAEFYILTNYPIQTGINFYAQGENNIANLRISLFQSNVKFIGNSGYGNVYKFSYTFQNQDCLDGEDLNGDYICYSDSHRLTNSLFTVTDGNVYGMQLYSFGQANFINISYGSPIDSGQNIKEDNEANLFSTIISLPNKLLSWFSALPGNISSSLSSFFSYLGEKITNLPSQLSGFFTSLGEKITNLPSQLSGFFTSLGDRIAGFFDFLITGISNILMNLFIPSDIVFDELKITFQNKLGFIYELPVQVIDFGLNLSSLNFTEMNSINFPSISILGTSFWQNQNISIVEAKSTFQPFRYLTDVLCVAVCVNALRRYREQLFGGGSYN